MNTWLEVSERGVRRQVPGDISAPGTTALATVDPDAIVRKVLDSQTQMVGAYLRRVPTTVDAVPQRSEAPYSSAGELVARNRRFYVTVAAYVALAGLVVAGIVGLATLAEVLPGDWSLPAWLAMTGIVALWLVRWTHQSELAHSPEGIALQAGESDSYAVERDADARFVVAEAVADAIRSRAQSELVEHGARIDATAAWLAAQRAPAAPASMSFRTEAGGTVEAGTPSAQEAPDGAIECSRYVGAPVTPDASVAAFLAFVGGLYETAQRTGDNLVAVRLPWSQRGDWPQDAKRRALAVLDAMDPPLLVAGAGGRYRLNLEAWPHRAITESALHRRWRRLD